jgi:hypothetical protein
VGGHNSEAQLAFDGTQFGEIFDDDSIAIARHGDPVGVGDAGQIYLRRLSPSGTVLGLTLLSEGIEESINMMSDARIVARPGGGFIVSWLSTNHGYDITAAVVNADGTKAGPNRWFTSDGVASFEMSPQLVPAGSGFLVAYEYTDMGTYQGASWGKLEPFGVRVQKLDANANPVGTPVLVTPHSGCHMGSHMRDLVYPLSDPAATWCSVANGFGMGAVGTISLAAGATSAVVVSPAALVPYGEIQDGSSEYAPGLFVDFAWAVTF